MKRKKLFIGLSFAFSSLIILGSYLISMKVKKVGEKGNEEKQKEFKEFTVKIEGAVKKPGEYLVKKGESVIEKINQSMPRKDADLSKFHDFEKFEKSKYIYVPYKENVKIQIRNISSFNDLVQIGIRKNIAQKIFEKIKSKKWKITLKEISEIDGVGSKTISKLEQKIIF
ncbi:hypothetical protein JN00_0482 [Metamycoplasma subdolum]|uniref:Competence protein ComEA n=1 Tax=Metamycoplasma subdolum TaxID=92407 RepID=A0A3L9ZZG3_9BACT|nr:hypothetical protein [Metamycoplasma subdolum]RMA77524.1 hypothetical protein JN00_0482 [Metamycoplasma subdolum]WPB50716.1 hypothetical protein R9C05_01025 [Metamycoplasma subdolum]